MACPSRLKVHGLVPCSALCITHNLPPCCRAHETEEPGLEVALRIEDKQQDILKTLRVAVLDALYEARAEVTRAVEKLAHAHSNSLAVRTQGVVTVHRARLLETSRGEELRLMTVMR